MHAKPLTQRPTIRPPTPTNALRSPDLIPQRPCTTAFWKGDRRKLAWTLTLGLVLLTVAQAAVPVALNLWSQRLFDALEQRNFARVLQEAGIAALIIGVNLVVMTGHLRAKRRLQVEWRADLSRRLLDQWMVRGRDYRLLKKGGLDNPDGRIAEDVRMATETAVDLALSLLYCVLLLVSFAQILWGLSGTIPVALGGVELAVPGYLVWLALAYAGLGAGVATWLGQPLTRAANQRHATEADFRFSMASARESGTNIPLQSIDSARPGVERQFDGLVGAWARQTRALANLMMFSSSWSVLSQAAPILVAAPRYVAGTITLGVLMQTAQAFMQMTQALAWPIDNMQRLAEARASFTRVTQLHDWLLEDGDRLGVLERAAAVDPLTATGEIKVEVEPSELAVEAAPPAPAVVVAAFDSDGSELDGRGRPLLGPVAANPTVRPVRLH